MLVTSEIDSSGDREAWSRAAAAGGGGADSGGRLGNMAGRPPPFAVK